MVVVDVKDRQIERSTVVSSSIAGFVYRWWWITNRSPRSVGDAVLARSGPQRVITAATLKLIVTGFAEHDVVALGAAEHIVAVPTEEGVVARSALDDVVVVSAFNAVVARTANEDVVTGMSAYRVIARSAVDGIGTERSKDDVVAISTYREDAGLLDEDRHLLTSTRQCALGRHIWCSGNQCAHQSER